MTFLHIKSKAPRSDLVERGRSDLGALRMILDQRGYTLIELIAAMTIFLIVLITSTAAFVSVSTSANKATAQRHVQQDARYNLEGVVRQVRAASIDYGFYAANANAPGCRLADRTLLPLLTTEADPATGAPITKRLIYFYNNGYDAQNTSTQTGYLVQYADANTNNTPSCATVLSGSLPAGATRTTLTQGNVNVTKASFIVTPTEDPTNPNSQLVARNVHPRVTMLLTVQTISSGQGVTAQSKLSALTVETTVSSRAIPLSIPLGQGTGGTSLVLQWTGQQREDCDPNNPPQFCANSPDGLSVYANSTPWRVRFRDPGSPFAGGTYDVTVTYKNESYQGLPSPTGYPGYNVTLSVNGGSTITRTLPVSPPGTSPRTFTFTGVTIPPGVRDLDFTWTNDSYTPGVSDANFAVTKVEVSQ